jgi:molybdopterin molybdotransferase
MKKAFFKVVTRAEALALFDTVPRTGEERIGTRNAEDRISSQTVRTELDVPAFARSTMDGYAVRAEDTFGASESSPVRMRVAGEVVMGTEPDICCKTGEAVAISTGGMIPVGADAVVMVEYTVMDGEAILVKRAVAPGEHTVGRGSDIAAGDVLLRAGSRIRAEDIGALAACGVISVSVFKRPRIAILSTGTELVPPDGKPARGQIRSINAWTLAILTERYGGEAIELGIVQDRREEIIGGIRKGLQTADMVVISGGSSVGTKDLTLGCIQEFERAEILANGLALKPGKPTILARIGKKPVIGLPGHPVSCMVIFYLIVRPIMHAMVSYSGAIRDQHVVRARIAHNIPSASGREEYVRVKIEKRDGALWAKRIPGGSGLISSLSGSDGLVRIDLEREGIEEGEAVDVIMM